MENRTNEELRILYDLPNLETFVKSGPLRRVFHVKRWNRNTSLGDCYKGIRVVTADVKARGLVWLMMLKVIVVRKE